MTWGGVSRLAKYWHHMPEAKTSMVASASGLPCSAVRIGASSSAEAKSTSAMSRTVLRRAASSSFQSRWALAAESKAASSWSRVHSGAWAKTSPLAGLTTPKESAAGTVSPPMVMTKSDMVIPLGLGGVLTTKLHRGPGNVPGGPCTRPATRVARCPMTGRMPARGISRRQVKSTEMLSRLAILRMASPRSPATETISTFAESSTGWVSTLSVMNSRSIGLLSIRSTASPASSP